MPKPLVEIGGRPILWHVMRIYADQGFKEFILCLGFGGPSIEARLREGPPDFPPDWRIEFLDTGLETQTGGRIKRMEPLVREEAFFVTYADGVADINLKDLLAFHLRHGRIGTMTVVNPASPFGEVVMGQDGRVTRFSEKPKLNRWINGGFFVFSRSFFKYLGEDDVLERGPLESLAHEGQLYGFRHDAFWCCMDTYKDALTLNELCREGSSPWLKGKP